MSLAERCSSLVRTIPDFPKPGILFRDISPLLASNFAECIDLMASEVAGVEWDSIDAIVGIESRGFILASGLAYAKRKDLLIIRKPGKLPPPLHTVSYALEYGNDSLQISAGHGPKHVLIVDDVLATGGTLSAYCSLCEKSGHTIVGILTLINLTHLNRFRWNALEPRSPLSY